MDYAELLFAAEVRKLAAELREAQMDRDMRPYEHTEATYQRDMRNGWGSEFPLSGFIPAAYQEIIATAKQVKALGGGGEQSVPSFWESSKPEG